MLASDHQTDLAIFENFKQDDLDLIATLFRSNPVSLENVLAMIDDTNLFGADSSSDNSWESAE
jgi:hypothetical protein